MQVLAVPGRDCRCKEARGRSKLGVCVESYSKTVGIVLSSSGVLCRVSEGDNCLHHA